MSRLPGGEPVPRFNGGAQRTWSQRRAEANRALREEASRVGGALEAAREEFQRERPPLRVPSLAERLEQALPGARLYETNPTQPSSERWVVELENCATWRGRGPTVYGHTRREAVDRAIALFGGAR